MPHFIHWCGFVGGWLLVVGPLQQSALELEAEVRESIEAGRKLRALPRVAAPSPWWWLVPPVAYLQRMRVRREQVRAAREALEPHEIRRLERIGDVARAWAFVAGGAFLIAVTETWMLRESYGWDEWVFWALVVVMIGVCSAFTTYRTHRRRGADDGQARIGAAASSP
jgi:hypothetical protein